MDNSHKLPILPDKTAEVVRQIEHLLEKSPTSDAGIGATAVKDYLKTLIGDPAKEKGDNARRSLEQYCKVDVEMAELPRPRTHIQAKGETGIGGRAV
jgi:hypothetical protein